jgi:membrane-associated protease RseP (regulator of RpoE activity)
MRKRTIIFALTAMVGATGIVAAAPDDQKPADSSTSPGHDDVTVTAGRGRLGFAAIQISPALRKALGAPADRGILVDKVRKDSAAARAGLRVGDVVLEVDADAVRSAGDAVNAISDRKKGDAVAIQIERGKEHLTLQAKLEDDAGPRLRAPDRLGGGAWDRFGGFDDSDAHRALEDMRKHVEELERRIDKLEQQSRT